MWLELKFRNIKNEYVISATRKESRGMNLGPGHQRVMRATFFFNKERPLFLANFFF